MSQGSTGEGGEKRKKGKTRKRKKEGGTFRVPRRLLFRTREDPEAPLRKTFGEGNDGEDGDDGDDEGDQRDGKGEGGDKGGEVGGDKGCEEEGHTGVRSWVPGARMRHGNPPPRRRGSCGGWGIMRLTVLMRLTHHQVTRRQPAK